jgi:hypothetical protein
VVIRVLLWHAPEQSAQRAALDASVRAVVTRLGAADIELDGPTLVEFGSDRSTST